MFKKRKIKNNTEAEDFVAQQAAKLKQRIEGEAEISVMPKLNQEQKVVSSSSRRTGIFIIAGGGVFLVMMALVFYYFLFYEAPVSSNSQRTTATNEESPAPAKPPESESSQPIVPDSSQENLLNSLQPEEELGVNEEDLLATSSVSISTPTQEDLFDSDQDGLSDKEELLLGSDPQKIDSDNDGYGDFSEVMSLYNPAGAGKISDSAYISQFSSESLGYKFLYPAAWSLVKVGGAEDSLVITSEDNHFLRVVVQLNPNFQSIESWYQENFSLASTPRNRIEESAAWRGVRSEDGLILYLTDLDRNYIYILSYTPSGEIHYYRNIFEMMIKSLEV